MRTIDRYVARYFLSSLLICGATLAMLYVLVDLVLNLDRLMRDDRSFLAAAVSYYGAQLPLVFQRFGSFVTLAGGMFAVARLQANNELVPMQAGGMSTFRAVLPVLVGALVAGGAEAAITEFAIPPMADTIRSSGIFSGSSAKHPGLLRDDQGNTLFVGGYAPETRTLRWVTFRERGPDGRVLRTYYGDLAVFTPGLLGREGLWSVQHGWVREHAASEGERRSYEQRELGEQGAILPTRILPIDVESLSQSFSLLSFGQLKRQSYERQSYLKSLRVQLFQRLTGPLAHPLLCLLGIPFVLRGRGRRGMFVGVLALVAICSLYFLTTFLFYELGSRGAVAPLWAALIPTIVFGLVAVAFWDRVQT